MTPEHLLRAARRYAMVSQRELAERAGVQPRTVADIERGAVRPSVATLERLLASVELELTLDERLPPAAPGHERYLRLTLTQRLYLAFGGRHHPSHDRHPPWRALAVLSRRGEVEVVGEAAVGTWAPVVCDRPRALIRLWDGGSLPDAEDTGPLQVAVVQAAPDHRAVPVALPGGRQVQVLPPHLMALDPVHAQHRTALRTAAALLDRGAGTDEAGRRAPTHRDVDLRRDTRYAMHTKAFGLRSPPDRATTRGWQLEGPVSMAQWFRSQGYPA